MHIKKWRVITLIATICTVFLLGSVLYMYNHDTETQASKRTIQRNQIQKTKHSIKENAIDKYFLQGALMLHARRYEEAIVALHEVLKLAPQLPEAHVNMGFAMLGIDKKKEAESFFRSAIDLRTSQVNAYYGLAVLRYVSELSNNRKSKTEILKNEKILFERNNENSKQTKEDTQASVDTLINDIFQKSHKADFSQEIQRYLLLAAKQGYIPAQFALGEVYFKGIGVAPDNVQAYAWAATAVAQNPPFGSLRRDEKAINLDNIKLNQAEAFAEEYMKKYTNIFDRSSVTVMR